MGEAKRRKKTFEVLSMHEIKQAIRNYYSMSHPCPHPRPSFHDFVGQREFNWDNVASPIAHEVTTKVEHHIAKKIRMLNSEHYETLYKAWYAKHYP